MYSLLEFFDKKNILRIGSFETLGSAKATHSKNILCYAMTKEYINKANKNINISCVITTEVLAKGIKEKAVVIDDEPEITFSTLVNEFISKERLVPLMSFKVDKSVLIHPTAIVSKKTKIGKNVTIGRHAIIEDYTILDENVVIGDNVIIGCEGFYFKRNKSGELVKFLHAGGVHLHKNVEVMTGSMVQRAHDANFTIVEEGTKISVNVNIGHSTKIGKHNMITGNVQIAGRVQIGDYCWIGTSATISDSVKIGDHCEIKIGSVVVKKVKDNAVISGNFAMQHSQNLKNYIRAQK